MDCLFVMEPSRGLGIGRQLFDAVLEEARARGIDEVQWQTPDWNDDAIRFYRALGAMGQPKMRFTIDLCQRLYPIGRQPSPRMNAG